jgi:hypothetical protein
MGNKMSISQNFGNVSPSLLLDFANTKTLDRRITFTRSTPACHYDGVTTALAEQNLTTYSGTVGGTNWIIYAGLTIATNNATAPDGTTTASLLTASSATKQSVYQTRSAIYVNHTLSIYAKAGTNSWIAFDDGTGGTAAWFNVSAGTVGTVIGGTATITSVGNGWYRCTYTSSGPATLTTVNGISVPNANNTGNQTIGNTVYVWGAQSELRTSATAYTATTTAAITNYIPVLLTAGGNQARFDCNPTTGESLGLLIEEQKTNVFFASEGNTSWSTDGTGSVLLDSATINPAGQAGGWIYKNAGYAYLNWGSGVSAGTWTYSVYIKKSLFNTTNVGRVSMFTPSVSVDYNFGTGAITLQSGSPVSYGCQRLSDTMARVWITVTITGATLGIGAFDNSTNSTLLWGLQIESGSFPTSYIKTVSAATTRTADAASMTGTNFSNWFNNNEGTLFSSITQGQGFFPCAFSITDGTNNNGFYVSRVSSVATPTTSLRYQWTTGAGVIADMSGGATPLFAVSYKTSEYRMATNNTLGSTSTNASMIPSLNTLTIANFPSGSFPLNGTIKKIAYYPIAVTSTQLQALTS